MNGGGSDRSDSSRFLRAPSFAEVSVANLAESACLSLRPSAASSSIKSMREWRSCASEARVDGPRRVDAIDDDDVARPELT